MARTPRDRRCFQDYVHGNVCFGCGTANSSGLQICSEWDGDDAVCVWQPRSEHQGWPGLTCGGIIATLIDCHCMATAMATAYRNENRNLMSHPVYRFATGALQIRYLKPTPVDAPLTLRARVTDVKDQRKYTLHCDLFARDARCVQAEVVAFLVYRSDRPGEAADAFGSG
jgi:acyl-coenzyme A thioesterase PaaI-like protein